MMEFYTSALILTWAAILILALALAGLVRQVHALSTGTVPRQDSLGPELGTDAPPLRSGDADPSLWGVPTVALFVDINCQSCERVLRLANSLAQKLRNQVGFVAVFAGDAEPLASDHVAIVDNADGAFARYQIPAVPYAVVVSSAGRVIGKAPVGADNALDKLIAGSISQQEVTQ